MKENPFTDLHYLARSLPHIKSGVCKYLSIMEQLPNVDVSSSTSFQTLFNGFYRIRRNSLFRNTYYSLLEQGKGNPPSFEYILSTLYSTFQRIEPSFSSKLVATLSPSNPVWDSVVLGNLEISAPAYYCKNRLQLSIATYQQLEQWYHSFLPSDTCCDVIKIFDGIYPNLPISATKKVDFSLWSLRN